MTHSDPNSFRDDSLSERQRLQWELLTSFGIITQLFEDRARRVLPADLPRPLFSILNHFVRLGGDRTVTDLARAFQTPQPGMTKSVQKLLDRGYLRVEGDPEDARRKRLFITDEGAAAHRKALMGLGPDAELVFGSWSTEELAELQKPIFRLRRWLDENRETRADAGPDAKS
ncbi:MAG: MarR family winged helix-turn-helix transcriptional regulator [Minwuia sp.]|uniref:MarR family winged helix-turn-helix transcriptional regulator n=1 Tax=Minwuia sp. TaxID=2493630 RepID=UPI003A87C47C